MSNLLRSVPLVLALLMPVSAFGQTGDARKPKDEADEFLRLIPADCCGALAVRNLKQLRERGDEWVRRLDVDDMGRPSTWLPMAWQFAGIHAGVDDDGPVALMILRYEDVEESIVVAVPFTSVAEMVGNFGLKPEDVADGKIVRVNTKDRAWGRDIFIGVRGRHIFAASSEGGVRLAWKQKSLADALTSDQRAAIDDADLLAHISAKGFGPGWDEVRDYFRKHLVKNFSSEDPETLAAVRQLVDHTRYAQLALRIPEGLAVHGTVIFQDEPVVTELLGKLHGERALTADVAGLPVGPPVLATAVRGSGDYTAAFGRAMSHWLFTDFTNMRSTISSLHEPSITGIFGELWTGLDVSRVGAYFNDDPATQGRLSVIGVLDPGDPARFLSEMQSLSTFINADVAEQESERPTREQIAELIEQLADRRFRTRQSATVKLRLLGETALPQLEEAMKSNNPEVAARAGELATSMRGNLKERTEEFLKNDLLDTLKPRFVFQPGLGIEGSDVVRIVMHDGPKATALRQQLEYLFGRNWDRIQLATVGKQIVMSFGSNDELFAEAIKNVTAGSAALEEQDALRTFRDRSPRQRLMEWHFSLPRLARLLNPEVPESDSRELSSFAVGTAPLQFEADLFIPFEELRVSITQLRGR